MTGATRFWRPPAKLTRGEVQELEQGLWTADLPDVDLLIRSGDSAHLSAGFMIWRISEARLCFVPELWPAVSPEQVRELLASAGASSRRYGA
jgi:undecaprenyl diphosphate synthase